VRSKARFIGAVEIGSAKIAVLIGELARDGNVNLIGFGECQSHGVVKGMVTDFKAASDATHSALLAAEQSSGVKIDEVYLAQTGGHLGGFHNQAEANVTAVDNKVSEVDIETVCRLAKAKSLPTDRTVVHHIRRPFFLDGKMVGRNPEHLHGKRLAVGYWTVHGLESVIANSIHVVRGFNVLVGDMILSSLASGTMMTTPQDRQHGALVIDIGAGATDFVFYRDGGPFLTGVVPVGGGHLTNDLTLGLRVTEGQAEKLKLRHGRALVHTRDKNDKVWLNGDFAIGDRQFPRQAIEMITEARVRELFEVVKKKLGPEFGPETCAAGVLLTGGGAKMPALADAATKVFGVPAQLGELPPGVDEKLNRPQHATVLGLLHYGLQNRTQAGGAGPRRSRGLLQKLFAGS
jgi:cell division protein FtsA